MKHVDWRDVRHPECPPDVPARALLVCELVTKIERHTDNYRRYKARALRMTGKSRSLNYARRAGRDLARRCKARDALYELFPLHWVR